MASSQIVESFTISTQNQHPQMPDQAARSRLWAWVLRPWFACKIYGFCSGVILQFSGWSDEEALHC